MRRFEITENCLEDYYPWEEIEDIRAGAKIIFEGLVRNHNEGHEVSSLEYQCYQEMAEKEGEKIVQEAIRKYKIFDAYCVHRVGHLQLKERAVVVVVVSAHRKEGYLASEFIINTLKVQVPIWKKEHYVSRKSEWVACHRCLNSYDQ